MTRNAKQVYRLSDEQLTKLAGQNTHSGVQDAWEHYRRIQAAGGRPVCFHSEFNGFTVLDDNASDASAIQRILRMEQQSKPFHG